MTNNRKRYVTIFPEFERVHLKKDVAMLPYSLSKYEDYDFNIVCYKNSEFSKFEVEKFNLVFAKRKNNVSRDFAKYLLINGKKIDILNLYHLSSSRNAFWIIIYKMVNPKGKVHIKLDADYRMLDIIDMYPKSLKGKFRAYIFRKKVDLYTVESVKMKELLHMQFDIEMKLLPNGIFREEEIQPVRTEEKERIFLTVGRLGTEQKATKDLLEAFALIADQIEWKLWLVGNIENEFNEYINRYFQKYEYLKERVIFFGNIDNSDDLTKIYRRASVFVLPSKWEGFALVLLEALECGDYLILSDQVPSSWDISNNGQFASIVPYHDVGKLSNAMLSSITKNASFEELKKRRVWIEENFTWKSIVRMFNGYVCDMKW